MYRSRILYHFHLQENKSYRPKEIFPSDIVKCYFTNVTREPCLHTQDLKVQQEK